VAKQKEEKAEIDGAPKRSLVSRIIPVLLVSILAGGSGFMQGALFRGSSSADASTTNAAVEQPKPEGEAAAEVKKDEPVAPKTIVRTLAPIISNLGNPSETWMRLEISILIDGKVQSDQDVIAVKASDLVVSYLRTIELKKIEGPSGFLHFREDLNDTLTAEFEGKITGVLIGSMVVE
jgi:flagellar protein FliL